MTRKFFGHSEDSASWLALGSLGAEEKSRFEAHLQQGCTGCEEDLRELANVVENLSLAAPAREPSIRVRQRLLASLVGDHPEIERIEK